MQGFDILKIDKKLKPGNGTDSVKFVSAIKGILFSRPFGLEM